MTNAERNAKILSLRGKKSYGLIAKEMGISRGTVAGVMLRKGAVVSTGRRGGIHAYAKKRLPYRNKVWTEARP